MVLIILPIRDNAKNGIVMKEKLTIKAKRGYAGRNYIYIDGIIVGRYGCCNGEYYFYPLGYGIKFTGTKTLKDLKNKILSDEVTLSIYKSKLLTL